MKSGTVFSSTEQGEARGLLRFLPITCLLGILVSGLVLAPIEARSQLKKLSDQSMSEVSGRSGITFDVNTDLNIGSIQVEDSDDNGVFVVNSLDIGSGNIGEGGAVDLTGLTLDVDGNDGVVIGGPSGDVSLGVDGLCIKSTGAGTLSDCSGVNSFGEFALTNADASNLQLKFQGSGEGLSVDINPELSADAVSLYDDDGYSGGSDGSLVFRSLDITSSGDITGLSVNADDGEGLVLGAPSGELTANAEDLCLMDSVTTSCDSWEIYGEFDMRGINFGSTNIQLRGHGTGVTADVELGTTINRISLIDSDGASESTCPGCDDDDDFNDDDNPGRLQLGSGNDGIDLSTNSELTGMTLDINPTNGLVIGMPSGGVDFTVDEVRIGNASGNAGTNLGSADAALGFGADNLSFNGSEVRMGAN